MASLKKSFHLIHTGLQPGGTLEERIVNRFNCFLVPQIHGPQSAADRGLAARETVKTVDGRVMKLAPG